MKKCLLKGVLALVLGGCLASCSQEENFYGSIVENKLQTYEKVFKDEFGAISPNQDWGFGQASALARREAAKTRTEMANANQWADANYNNLLVPPALTPLQIAVVKKYFQTVPNLGYQDPGWSNYFMQQVYKGHTSVPQGCATPEAYMAADNQTYIIASDHMDHLAAIDGSFVDHINNFNHGDCSENSNVLDNGGNTNSGPFHTDKIMLMQNSTTKSFGYYNSDGSVRHTEYTGLVSYQTIMSALGAEANCLDDGWNRSFMGFDFEQMVGSDIYAIIGWGDNPNDYAYYEYNGQQYHYLNSNMNMYCGDLKEYNDAPSGDELASLISGGYLPVSGSADKKWVKVGGCADGYFSDWIVCLTEAKSNGGSNPGTGDIPIDNYTESQNQIPIYKTTEVWKKTSLVESGRVFCEDLGMISSDELDFNDVVFDAYIFKEVEETITYRTANGSEISGSRTSDESSSYYATVVLLAAGGTLPLSLANTYEVHDLFEVNTKTLVNTTDTEEGAYYNQWTTADPVFIDRIDDISSINGISIRVKYESEALELRADQGEVPHKICVDLGTAWPTERTNIGVAYTGFSTYVGEGTEFWKGAKDDTVLKNLTYDAPKVPASYKYSEKTEATGEYTSGGTSSSGGYEEGWPVLIRKRN